MITVGMNYEVNLGKEGEFENAFGKVIDLIETMEGHTFTKLYHEVISPRSYLIVSEWETMKDFQTFMTSKEFREAADWAKDGILEGRPRHQIWKNSGSE